MCIRDRRPPDTQPRRDHWFVLWHEPSSLSRQVGGRARHSKRRPRRSAQHFSRKTSLGLSTTGSCTRHSRAASCGPPKVLSFQVPEFGGASYPRRGFLLGIDFRSQRRRMFHRNDDPIAKGDKAENRHVDRRDEAVGGVRGRLQLTGIRNGHEIQQNC